MANKHPSMLDTNDLMDMLGCSRNTVLRLCQEGAIPSFKVGRRWYSTIALMSEHFEHMAKRNYSIR